MSTKANILGIDHVGINVPDLQQAMEFFSDIFGFSEVTRLGPFPLDESWKKNNNMHLNTGAVTIKMVHAGTGASIEVFSYQDNHGNKVHPGSDDIGASHIGFYTADMNGAVAFLKSKGIQFLGEPFTMPSGDTAGETWVYFLAPWGAKMELVSYPDGKGYEKNDPEKVLWSPKNGAGNSHLEKVPLTEEEIRKIVEQHLVLWNERDESKRKIIMEQIYAPDMEMVDRHFVAVGHKAISGFVAGLQEKFPDSFFSHAAPVNVHHNIARMFWQLSNESKTNSGSGMDMFVIENGKVQKLYVFVDQA
ncbi:VOC family protein [Mucilaginibacter rubeus]|uniref:Glyoxalase n=1 Tax=Mucilaginibacter rubeus TaxID=2027860 RepID=A0A5C1I180_9SPHI|nr:VOC family protein [Mucilaginibacter rubeus]QEM11735.1 glyoxalase [Mucilaginibacter rubeus]